MKKIFISTFLFLSIIALGQTKSLLPNRTLKDTVFNKGDIIKIPLLIYDLSYPIRPETVDSLKPVAEFLKEYQRLKVEIGCHTQYEPENHLTEFRAKLVCEVLVKTYGVNADKITYKGYGSTLPIITKKEISKAKTEEEKIKFYLINQRTELKVLDTQ